MVAEGRHQVSLTTVQRAAQLSNAGTLLCYSNTLLAAVSAEQHSHFVQFQETRLHRLQYLRQAATCVKSIEVVPDSQSERYGMTLTMYHQAATASLCPANQPCWSAQPLYL